VIRFTEIQDILKRFDARVRDEQDRGVPAQYIPELANVDPAQFAVSVCMNDGTVLNAGQAETPFSIQSVSKFLS